MKNLKHYKIAFYALVGILFLGFCASAQSETHPDSIPQGHQGSVNPLNENTVVLSGEELLDQSFPGSWALFGTGVRMTIGGYVKADYIQDFDYVGDRYEFELGSIAVDGTPERAVGGGSSFHSKESRFNLDFRSKAKWKNGKEFPMRVFVEVDWFFDSPSMALNTRLRQAYGVIGRFVFGRTWTTSGDLTAIPGCIDFSGGDALYGGRVTQIKWMDNLSKNFKYALALEELSPQVANPNGYSGASRLMWPNVAGMIKYHGDKGSTVQLGVDVFPVSWKGSTEVKNSQEVGYALTLMSRIVFPQAHYYDAITWGGGYGQGQANKIIALSWDGKGSGVVGPDGVDLAPSWFAYIGYNHYWTKTLNSTFATHWAGTDLSPLQTDNTIKGAGSAHVNLIYFPYERISVGVEYMWGQRENFDGVKGTASRLQFMAKFKFH
ncbi:DcaP family trimeric outer membrane transporter [Draconibacterium sp. IB214405]|uniref:DcaP family trimeric outer membrane transporter n=1 Tax=Draconibacterium sp. IB214405 TaxID=3097352 RepID=UPI002A0BF8F7|nr:DcaP family trimeric outer membrane transporter [Draconibacterium sp. IB214405]MDX8339035.1 DcaP family trimeric outer membrane transporter [Draconibacterium sp. IB214405]